MRSENRFGFDVVSIFKVEWIEIKYIFLFALDIMTKMFLKKKKRKKRRRYYDKTVDFVENGFV